jgi:hypothetical protein
MQMKLGLKGSASYRPFPVEWEISTVDQWPLLIFVPYLTKKVLVGEDLLLRNF